MRTHRQAAVHFAEWAGWLNFVDEEVRSEYFKRFYRPFLVGSSWREDLILVFTVLGNFALPVVVLVLAVKALPYLPWQFGLPLSIVMVLLTLFLFLVINWNAASQYPCVPRGATIDTPDGCVPIERLGRGDFVLAWDPNTATITPSKIVSIRHFKARALCHISLHHGQVILATPSHTFLTGRGWLTAGELQPNHRLIRVVGGVAEHVEVASVSCSKLDSDVVKLITAPPNSFLLNGFVVHSFTILRRARGLLQVALGRSG